MQFTTRKPDNLQDLYEALDEDTQAIKERIEDLTRRIKDPKMHNARSMATLANALAIAQAQYGMLVEYKLSLVYIMKI